jgi:hypothetical protein
VPARRGRGLCFALPSGLGITLAAVATGTAAAFCRQRGRWCGVRPCVPRRVSHTELSSLAPASERAGPIATIYIVAYLAFSVPVVAAGLAVTRAGLHDTSIAYAAVLPALVAVALASLAIRAERDRNPADDDARFSAQPHIDLPPGADPAPGLERERHDQRAGIQGVRTLPLH